MATNKDFIVKNGIQVGNSSIITANNSTEALRITQTGSGHVLVVEDSANPDSTPLVIDTNGTIFQGQQSSINVGSGISRIFQQFSSSSAPSAGASFVRGTADASGPVLSLGKSRATSLSSFTVVNSGDSLGAIRWAGTDGNTIENYGAEIASYVDGTPGVNNMPGRLSFATTPLGSNTIVERLRITNQGLIQFNPGSITSNFYLANTGANPLINFDSNDGLIYDRTNNTYNFVIGSSVISSISSANSIFNNEVISTTSNAFRAYGANRSAILRNDNSDFHILVTANNDPYGTWNSYRPFSINLATGNLSLCTTGNNTSFGGNVYIPDSKNLFLGSGSDLYLIHDGVNSSITNQTGNLTINNANSGSYILLQANNGFGSNFELWDTGAYLDATTFNIRSQNSGTTFATFNSTGLTIGGNLTVNGTTTTINSTTVTVDDPIITLGGDTAPAADDNKDRGVEFRWHNGSVAKSGFFGFDDSTGKFTFIPDATNTSEVFSGTAGTISANVLESTVATGTAPLTVSSTTLVANLNSDLLDGYTVGTSGAAIPLLNGINTWSGQQNFLSTNNWFGPSTSNTSPNSAIEIGTAQNQSFIDFHSSNTVVDYNARISCAGATAGVAGGALSYEAASHSFLGGDTLFGRTNAGSQVWHRIYNGSGTNGSQVVISLDPGNNGNNIRDSQIRATNNGSNQTTLEFYTANAGTPVKQLNIDNVGNAIFTSSVSATSYSSTVATGTTPLTVNSTTLVANLNANYISGYSVSTANSASTIAVRGADGSETSYKFISTAATGVAPLTVSSTTLVTNLNADLLDGYNVGTSGATIPVLNGNNTWSGNNTFNNISTGYSTSNSYIYFASANTANQAMISVNCRSAEFLIQANTATEYYVSKILALQDGSTSQFIEYGSIATGNTLATFECDVSAGNIRVLATPLFSNTLFKIDATQIQK